MQGQKKRLQYPRDWDCGCGEGFLSLHISSGPGCGACISPVNSGRWTWSWHSCICWQAGKNSLTVRSCLTIRSWFIRWSRRGTSLTRCTRTSIFRRCLAHWRYTRLQVRSGTMIWRGFSGRSSRTGIPMRREAAGRARSSSLRTGSEICLRRRRRRLVRLITCWSLRRSYSSMSRRAVIWITMRGRSWIISWRPKTSALQGRARISSR